MRRCTHLNWMSLSLVGVYFSEKRHNFGDGITKTKHMLILLKSWNVHIHTKSALTTCFSFTFSPNWSINLYSSRTFRCFNLEKCYSRPRQCSASIFLRQLPIKFYISTLIYCVELNRAEAKWWLLLWWNINCRLPNAIQWTHACWNPQNWHKNHFNCYIPLKKLCACHICLYLFINFEPSKRTLLAF